MARWLELFRTVRVTDSRPQPSARTLDATGEHIRLTNPWHAVSIEAGRDSCEAARALRGQRFLSAGPPPTIPLKVCDVAVCTCRYRHHDDRRASAADEDTLSATNVHPLRRRTDAPTF